MTGPDRPEAREAPRPNRYPRSGPARGLIVRLRAGEYHGAGRCLIHGMLSRTLRGAALRTNACVWCGEPLARRGNWHGECVRAYLAAKGATVYPGGRTLLLSLAEHDRHWRDRFAWWTANPTRPRSECPVVLKFPCDECGRTDAGVEVDHRLALSVAHERRELGCRRWWRAWTLANLRPLCHECHATKTGADRRELAALRRELAARASPQARFSFDEAQPSVA